jgi:ferredoxin, 2Fe-2S
MTVVTVRPSGIELDVRNGETVAEAAWRLGYRWPTKCWGQAECMACFAKVVDGERSAVPAAAFELDQMRLFMTANMQSNLVRLGCQLTVRGPGLVLEKNGVRPEDTGNSTAQANTTNESGRT